MERIQKEFKTEIGTSKGFGYVAAISICIILSLPFICDIFSKFGQNKIHSQN